MPEVSSDRGMVNARVQAATRRRRRREAAAAARAALRRAPTPVDLDDRRAVQVLVRPEDIEPLREAFLGLRTEYAGPSNHPDWWVAQAHVPEPDAQMCLVVLWEDARVRAVAPLLRSTRVAGKLRLVNCDDASGFLYEDEAALAELVDLVLGLRRAVALPSLVEGSPTARLVQARSAQGGYLRWNRPYAMGPSVELDERFEQPLAPLSSKRRKSARRSLRQAEAMGAVSFHVDEVDGRDVSRQFEDFLRIEGSGWKGREGTAMYQDVPQRERFRRFIGLPAIRDQVRFGWMCIDGNPVAAELTFIGDGRMWVIKGGYDESYSRCSPGLLLELHLMSWAAEHGLERFELMGLMEDWKRPFGDGPTLLHTRVYPLAPRGLLAIGLEAIVRGRRMLGKHVRARLAAGRERGTEIVAARGGRSADA